MWHGDWQSWLCNKVSQLLLLEINTLYVSCGLISLAAQLRYIILEMGGVVTANVIVFIILSHVQKCFCEKQKFKKFKFNKSNKNLQKVILKPLADEHAHINVNSLIRWTHVDSATHIWYLITVHAGVRTIILGSLFTVNYKLKAESPSYKHDKDCRFVCS